MAVLGNPIVRISMVDGKLKANNVDWKSPDAIRNQLAIDRKGIVLNNNKTPLHWETLNFNNLPMTISNLSGQIFNLDGIRWVG